MNEGVATPPPGAPVVPPANAPLAAATAPLAAAAATLAAWQARGAQPLDPVRLAWMAALVRRGAAQPAAVQRQLLQRLAPAMAACEQGLALQDQAGLQALQAPDAATTATTAAAAPMTTATTATTAAQPTAGPLAALLQHIQRHACNVGDADAGAAPELKTLHHFRAHWQRLRLEKRLTQARATMPGQAGPLNSHSLVLQALTQLQALSPAYLQHFMTQVDTLSWLEQAQAAVAAAAVPRGAGAASAAGERRRRPARSRPG